MVFGKIEYLNLLPFHIFMKRFTRSSQQKMSMHYKRGVPAKINREFQARRVDAAFISSVGARGYKHIALGIIAKKEVLSVLVIPNSQNLSDSESATSNKLAKILGVQGEVCIGDKALRYYLQNKPHIDLAKEWNERYNLPFVFALFCHHSKNPIYKKIEKKFLHSKVKIPYYILKDAEIRTKVDAKEIKNYLSYISYDFDKKAQMGLKKFYSFTK